MGRGHLPIQLPCGYGVCDPIPSNTAIADPLAVPLAFPLADPLALGHRYQGVCPFCVYTVEFGAEPPLNWSGWRRFFFVAPQKTWKKNEKKWNFFEVGKISLEKKEVNVVGPRGGGVAVPSAPIGYAPAPNTNIMCNCIIKSW